MIDHRKVDGSTTVFVAAKAPRHAAEWSDAFRKTVEGFPEIVEVSRLSGERDDFLRIVVPDIETFDFVYQRLIARLRSSNLPASIAMER